jgi:tetratricopeptide (TPR) repeat protein
MYDVDDFTATEELLAEVIDEAQRVGDRQSEARARAHHALVLSNTDTTVTAQAALDQATEAMHTLEGLDDEVGAVRAMAIVGFLTFMRGDVDGANALARTRLERAKQAGLLSEIRNAVRAITGNLYFGSTPASEALEEIERLLPLVRESPAATAQALRMRAVLLAMLGRFDEAREAAERTVALMEEVGVEFLQTRLGFWLGPMHMLAGDYEAAERVLSESIAKFEALGDKGFTSTLAAELAEALLTQGRIDEAEEAAARSRALTAEGDTVSEIGWRRAMAKVFAARGSMDEAERLAREAVEVGDGTTYATERGNAWMRLGDVLTMAGKTEEAAGALGRALELFERKGNVVSAERARQELAALDAS